MESLENKITKVEQNMGELPCAFHKGRANGQRQGNETPKWLAGCSGAFCYYNLAKVCHWHSIFYLKECSETWQFLLICHRACQTQGPALTERRADGDRPSNLFSTSQPSWSTRVK
jgi:hypothetical protein